MPISVGITSFSPPISASVNPREPDRDGSMRTVPVASYTGFVTEMYAADAAAHITVQIRMNHLPFEIARKRSAKEVSSTSTFSKPDMGGDCTGGVSSMLTNYILWVAAYRRVRLTRKPRKSRVNAASHLLNGEIREGTL